MKEKLSLWAKFKAPFLSRYLTKQTPTSETLALNREILRRDLVIHLTYASALLGMLLLCFFCGRQVATTPPAPTPQATAQKQAEEALAAALEETESKRTNPTKETVTSQIVSSSRTLGISGSHQRSSVSVARPRAHGTLIKVKSLNLVEAFETAPIFAQIQDNTLGLELIGSTLIGEASPNTNVGRMMIRFTILKVKGESGGSIKFQGNALSLDGSLGLLAEKKEGLINRGGLASGASAAAGIAQSSGRGSDFKDILLRALLHGFGQELGTDAEVLKQRGSTWVLAPETEFFVQLTSNFPEN